MNNVYIISSHSLFHKIQLELNVLFVFSGKLHNPRICQCRDSGWWSLPAAGGGCIVMSILIDGLGYTETKWNKVTTLY